MTLCSMHPSHPGTMADMTDHVYHTIRQVTPFSGSIKTMNHTGKEEESKQAVGK